MLKADDEARFDIWCLIQKEREEKNRSSMATEWPQQPLLRRSSSLMSQQSLELCTESLGSETGADSFVDHLDPFFSSASGKAVSFEEEGSFFSKDGFRDKEDERGEEAAVGLQRRKKELSKAYHHCSNGRAPRSFPPPISSSSIQMRSTRRDGRLILEAIFIPPHNHLHAERQGGRLLLSFINPEIQSNAGNLLQQQITMQNEDADEEEDGDEAEGEDGDDQVKVVERGNLMDVAISTQPQLVNRAATVKVFLPSSAVYNFVVETQLSAGSRTAHAVSAKELIPSAAAVAAAAPVNTSTSEEVHNNYLLLHHVQTWGSQMTTRAMEVEAEGLITSKTGSAEEVLRDMMRYGELRLPLNKFYIQEALLHCRHLLSWTEIIK